MQKDIREATVEALLAREGLSRGFGALDAVWLVRSQPFHWLGLAVLRSSLVIVCLVAVMMVGGSWLAADLWQFVLDPARVPTSLRPVLGTVETTGWGPLPIAAMGMVGVLPWLMAGNLALAMCCVVALQRQPSVMWWKAVILGLVPLRLVASRWMPAWQFWGGTRRGVMGINARILQASALWVWVDGRSREEVERRWERLIVFRLREVADSLYSYVYVRDVAFLAIAAGVLFVIYAGGEYLEGSAVAGWVDWLNPVVVVMGFAGWTVLNRCTLMLTLVTLLDDPSFDTEAGNHWIRLGGMLVAVVLSTGTTFVLRNLAEAIL